MTDNEIIKALECCFTNDWNRTKCDKCKFYTGTLGCVEDLKCASIDLITRQQAEIGRLHDEVSKARRKALLEASSKFAGHSDYHGDTILCKLICMSEGKEVGIAKPLDKSKIKSEAVREFADRVKMAFYYKFDEQLTLMIANKIDNLVKEMVGDME